MRRIAQVACAMALCVAWTVPARAGNAIGTVFYIAMENHN